MHDAPVEFRLYIAGESPNSRKALANLQRFCDEYLPNRHAIEVVDVLDAPKRALEDGVFLTPLLAITGGAPAQTILGALSDPQVLVDAVALRSA